MVFLYAFVSVGVCLLCHLWYGAFDTSNLGQCVPQDIGERQTARDGLWISPLSLTATWISLSSLRSLATDSYPSTSYVSQHYCTLDTCPCLVVSESVLFCTNRLRFFLPRRDSSPISILRTICFFNWPLRVALVYEILFFEYTKVCRNIKPAGWDP